MYHLVVTQISSNGGSAMYGMQCGFNPRLVTSLSNTHALTVCMPMDFIQKKQKRLQYTGAI